MYEFLKHNRQKNLDQNEILIPHNITYQFIVDLSIVIFFLKIIELSINSHISKLS